MTVSRNEKTDKHGHKNTQHSNVEVTISREGGGQHRKSSNGGVTFMMMVDKQVRLCAMGPHF